MTDKPLNQKRWNGKCPVPECGCNHQDEYYWVNWLEVEAAVDKFKKRIKKNQNLSDTTKRYLNKYILEEFGEFQ